MSKNTLYIITELNNITFLYILWDYLDLTTGQPYKFGGKELMTANGLNEYDFGARQYYTAIPGFTRIDPMAEKYPWLSPYLYCINNPINNIDPDGRDVFVWATMLPDGPKNLKAPTHTFITVSTHSGETKYYAYGSEFDGVKGAISGQLIRRHYRQDQRVYSGKNKDPQLLKSKIKVDVPDGMTQEEFDKKVIDVAESFGKNKNIRYFMLPYKETQGNCNTSTTTILFKAGLSEDKLQEIKDIIPGLDIGFGTVKPWKDDEQKATVKREQNETMKRYESLEKSLP